MKGDAGNDTFAIDALPQGWNLSLDGKGGTNTLDYSGYSADVTVNLARGTASGLGAIQNIRNVTGSNGNNTLVGDANANVLIGGTGRNILIGGGAPISSSAAPATTSSSGARPTTTRTTRRSRHSWTSGIAPTRTSRRGSPTSRSE